VKVIIAMQFSPVQLLQKYSMTFMYLLLWIKSMFWKYCVCSQQPTCLVECRYKFYSMPVFFFAETFWQLFFTEMFQSFVPQQY